MYKRVLIVSLVFLFMLGGVFAETTHVISNSENWKDVYSTLLYSNLKGLNSDFLVSTNHGPILLDGINKQNEIEVITSKSTPFVFNYPALITSKGFKAATEKVVDSANLELINDLSDIQNFIVIGDYYGYNAMAITPYAIKTKAWVFIANRENIAEIDVILTRRNINSLTIYGYTDREIGDTLQKYNPKTINTGDKFDDNIEIVKEYQKLGFSSQVLLTNGEFIEKELMQGTSPILFTGKESVPQKIADYIKNSQLTVGVLIGNDLINAATNIRRDTGISVMVKFARSARAQTGGVAAVENLDLFPLPTPSLYLEVYTIKYNRALSQLEVTYRSKSNIPAYLKGTVTLLVGSNKQKVGDLEPIFISPNDFKTVRYTGITLQAEESLTAEIYTLFGETANSFDRVLQGNYNVSYINVIDSASINICENCVKYNTKKESFTIEVENIGEVDSWMSIEISNININGVKKNIGSQSPIFIKAGKKGTAVIPQQMDDIDLKNNEYITLKAYYGEKQDSLSKELQGKFKLIISSFDIVVYAIVALIIILLILLVIIFLLKRRERDL